jgi:hypothetical protein
MDYLLSHTDTQRVWFTRQSLSDFTQHYSRTIIEMNMHEYFDRLSSRFADDQSHVSDVVDEAQSQLADLTETLQDYNDTMVVRAEFVR